MIRKTVTKLIAIVLSGAMITLIAPWNALSVRADEDEVRLDPFTGLPVDQSADIAYDDANQSRKEITDGIYYDYMYGSFVYPIGNGTKEVTSNVADGMVVSEPVIINVPSELLATLYVDGNETTFDGTVKSAGEYTLMVAVDGHQKTVMSFTIVSSATGRIEGYNIPNGFHVKSATCDGQEVQWTNRYVPMSLEGLYSIEYACDRTDINYFLNVRIDHTPPQVTMEGVREDGKARGPVTITGLTESDRVAIIKDGEEFKTISNKLTQSGKYRVIVTDNADNRVTYDFTIMIYLDVNGIVFFIIIAAVIGAVVAYIMIQRKNLKVR
jgi:hypothetical protein